MQRQLMQSKKQLMQLQKETWNNSGLMGFKPWPFQYWCSSLTSRVIKPTGNSWSLKWFVISGLSLSGRGWDFPGCYDHGPRLLSKENRKKNRTNDNAHLLVVFTWQLEILMRTLNIPGKDDMTIVRQMINGESTIHIPSYLPWRRYYFIPVVTSSLSCLIACYHILYNLEWMLFSIIQN